VLSYASRAFLDAIESLPILEHLLASGPASGGELKSRVKTIARDAFAEFPIVDNSACALFEAGPFTPWMLWPPRTRSSKDDHSPQGSYWHGMLHRREGDFWNSKYWLQRAGRIEALKGIPNFDPVAFVTRCERASGKTPQELLSPPAYRVGTSDARGLRKSHCPVIRVVSVRFALGGSLELAQRRAGPRRAGPCGAAAAFYETVARVCSGGNAPVHEQGLSRHVTARLGGEEDNGRVQV
jgi:hypothetical protein